MKRFAQLRAELTRMEEACRINLRHLKIIDRQMRSEAERMTMRERPKQRQYGRHATTWTPADERHYRSCLDAAFEARRMEIEALRCKIRRQEQAIASLRHRLGINEALQLPTVQPTAELQF